MIDFPTREYSTTANPDAPPAIIFDDREDAILHAAQERTAERHLRRQVADALREHNEPPRRTLPVMMIAGLLLLVVVVGRSL